MERRSEALAALRVRSSQPSSTATTTAVARHPAFHGFTATAAAYGKFRHNCCAGDERYADLILNLHPIDRSCSPSGSPRHSEYSANLEFFQIMLEPQLQPLPPFPKSAESMQVFDEHVKLAEEYIRVQAELRLLTKRKQELSEDLSKDVETVNSSGVTEADKYINEAFELQAERDSLRRLHENLNKQLAMLKNPRLRNFNDEWVMLQ